MEANLSSYFSSYSSSYNIIHSNIIPIIKDISLVSSLFAVLFLIIGAYYYITSSGSPDKLNKAKRIIMNALIGLIIVIAAFTISNLLSSAYHPPLNNLNPSQTVVLNDIKPQKTSNSLIDIVIKTLSGVLGNIIGTIGVPFLRALTYFTSSTPLPGATSAVYKLWVSAVGIADALIVLAIVLMGLKIMTSSALGFGESNLKQLLPQIILVFIFMNASIYLIDYLVQISNFMIKAISNNNAINNLWLTLESIVHQSSSYSLAALLIMIVFLILSIILLIFYVTRIVALYVGAVLSPLLVLCVLIPGLRDLAIAAAKKYTFTIFILFIHVVILELAAALLSTMSEQNKVSADPLMSLILGLATIISLLKTQGVMANLSYASVGPRIARNLGQRLIFNVSYLGGTLTKSISGLIPQSSYGNVNYGTPNLGTHTDSKVSSAGISTKGNK